MNTIERRLTIGMALFGAITIFSALILFVLVPPVETRRIASRAMEPALQLNDVVLVEKYSALTNSSFKRGEVIEFSTIGPDQTSERAVIRRIIGLPGDKVRLDSENNLIINAKVSGIKSAEVGKIDDIVPRGQILVAADCWNAKLDDLSFGLVEDTQCIGRVVLKLAPYVGPVK